MHKFLSLPKPTQAAAIQETAAQMQLHPVPVEKDFWVCVLLRELFALNCVRDRLIFKGGTSLSKAYGLIDRFSEDIDLSVDSSAFDFPLGPEDYDLPVCEKAERLRSLFREAEQFLKEKFVPELEERLSRIVPDGGERIKATFRREDFHIIHFTYPRILESKFQNHYTKQDVQIDLSVRAEHEPSEIRSVEPYIAGHFPDIFDNPKTEVKVLSAKRTFWEKVTIFHAESFKDSDRTMPRRIARHAYDLHKFMQCQFGRDALKDFGLLRDVARHKAALHPQEGVEYLQACKGRLRVVPHGYREEQLANDYSDMLVFFMSDPPPFEEILESLQIIEKRTNDHHRDKGNKSNDGHDRDNNDND